VADADDHAQLALQWREIRRGGQTRDIAHPSRIRRTIGLRKREKEKEGFIAPIGGEDDSMADRDGWDITPSSLWDEPDSPDELKGGKRKMDEHGCVIPEEEYDELIVPKVESPGEEAALALIERHRRSMEVLSPVTAKRPRGRPRKHPVLPEPTNKVTKGRSKTGCITCRKRKKKCDETKPRCKCLLTMMRFSPRANATNT
jgi:hypothetical protein